LGYPQPGLKTMAKLKLGLDIPKEEQDSNWMLRPLRDSQISYASRDAALLLPLLRILADECDAHRDHPEIGPRLANLPKEMRHLLKRVRAYTPPKHDPVVEKIKHLGSLAVDRALKLTALRWAWGNEGDVGAVMELGNRWLTARLTHPPATKEALERTISNPRFRRKRLDALWAVFSEGAPQTQEDPESSDALIWNNPGQP
jgi:ribonuclease D